MRKRKIIIDCDPGVDDALALAYAAANREFFELLAITTVSGNLALETVTKNALKLTELYKMDVPVVMGAAEPLMREAVHAPHVHGDTGLGYCQLPEPTGQPAGENAAVFIQKKIMALPEDEKITLVLMGPMTNAALLLKTFPEVKARMEKIVFMGGAACGGNITAAAEFNLYADPEAAKIVFQSGIPLVLCGLDATEKCFLTKKQIMKLCQSNQTIARACGDMLGYSLETINKYRQAVSVHDVAPLMYLIHPEIFRAEKAALDVDCSDGISRGATICNARWWHEDSESWKDFILMNAETEKFQEYLIEAVYELALQTADKEGI